MIHFGVISELRSHGSSYDIRNQSNHYNKLRRNPMLMYHIRKFQAPWSRSKRVVKLSANTQSGVAKVNTIGFIESVMGITNHEELTQPRCFNGIQVDHARERKSQAHLFGKGS